MTINYTKQSNRHIWYILAAVLLLFLLILGNQYYADKGQVSSEEWLSVSKDMTQEEVIQQLGRPINRSNKAEKIRESYHIYQENKTQDNTSQELTTSVQGGQDLIGSKALEAALNSEQAEVEMLQYQVEEANHFIYFVDGSLVLKL